MTIKEVARLAGVSSAAVSRYMNGGSVSEEKRARIARAIEETGYRPDMTAQTLRTGRVRQIGVIVPKIFSESVSQIMDGISECLAEKNYMTLLGCAGIDDAQEIRYLDIMERNRVAGIILMGTTMDPVKEKRLRECRVPLVVTGQNFEGFPCVYHDDFHAVKALTSLVLEKGRRRLAYIGVTERDFAAGKARREGTQAALLAAGIDPETMPCTETSFDAEGGFQSARFLLAQHPDLDGFICATDNVALGAMMAVRESGRSVPADVSIVGVGDCWAGTISAPPLTTAHLRYRQCGVDAVRMLLQRIEQEDPEQGEAQPSQIRQIRLPYTIIERGSV